MLIALTFFIAPRAHAYRTASDLEELSDKGKVAWRRDAIGFDIDPPSHPILSSLFISTVADALATWSEPTCSGVVFDDFPIAEASAEPGDGRNTIQWVESDWTERGLDPDSGATTDLQFSEASEGWAIVEADIYVDATAFQIPDTQPAQYDEVALASALAHEVGHSIGLLHPCELDPSGDEPRCADHDELRNALMHPEQHATLSLAEDDVRGLCFLYPREVHETLPREVQESDASVPCGEDAGIDDCGPVGDFGATCAAPTECQTGLCLLDNGADVCTRTCDDFQPCPTAWSCGAIGDEQVCVPPSSGCSVRHVTTSSPHGALAFIQAILALLVSRRTHHKRT